jgi:hypothetical protein
MYIGVAMLVGAFIAGGLAIFMTEGMAAQMQKSFDDIPKFPKF